MRLAGSKRWAEAKTARSRAMLSGICPESGQRPRFGRKPDSGTAGTYWLQRFASVPVLEI
jgi:hypothetical protein